VAEKRRYDLCRAEGDFAWSVEFGGAYGGDVGNFEGLCREVID
jgi:hypothetical protein